MKYSDQLVDWLVEFGYTHCFCVGGGNIMHLTESINRKIKCIPVIHEVAAGIATEYFNETSENKKAFALVTAGPGLTNIVTSMAGAFLESRELLVIGGQVKTTDLLQGEIRQNGIQEIAGVELVKSICKQSIRMEDVWDKSLFYSKIKDSFISRKGPVFIEIPLDIQARNVNFTDENKFKDDRLFKTISNQELNKIVSKIKLASRPVIMLGGGVNRESAKSILALVSNNSVPIVTTWNAADRIASDHPNYCGRPNTWGQRSSNIILQQADLLIAIGTRLGMQQTGFNWQEFIPVGEIVQIDIDKSELNKGHPVVGVPLAVDANDFIVKLFENELGSHHEWLSFCKNVRAEIPLVEENVNKEYEGFVSPYKFIQKLSKLSKPSDIIIPCSSGGAFTIMMQVFEQKAGQLIVTDKGLASMGYGLSGAIGAAFAHPDSRVILVEGDGGFAQNLQEIGTAAINNLNLKVFIFDDGGYASIRMTQKNYFDGSYVGCDTNTGLGLPNWLALFKAWNVDAVKIDEECFLSGGYEEELNKDGFSAFIVSIAPEQTYFPKISSKVTSTGEMVSNPLHLMTPELPGTVSEKVFRYINVDDSNE
jgi:acetolactate synthase I/II/III large subunit